MNGYVNTVVEGMVMTDMEKDYLVRMLEWSEKTERAFISTHDMIAAYWNENLPEPERNSVE